MLDVPQLSSRSERLWLALILSGLLAALVYLAWDTGLTADEPSHLVSSYLYWQGRDILKPHDMPPVMKIVGGWVSLFFKVPLPVDNPEIWGKQHEWWIGIETVSRMPGPELQKYIFFSRLPLLIFPLMTASLLWWWGRQIFSPVVGLCLALLYALEPTALGHGALFKNDLAATFGYTLFWYRAWRFWWKPNTWNVAWLACGLLAATLAKMSMLVLLPIAPCIVFARLLQIHRSLLRPLAALVLLAVIVYAGTVAAYQFDVGYLTPADTRQLRADSRVPHFAVMASQVFRYIPIPTLKWQGLISLLRSNAERNPVYMLGTRYPNGHPLYFLVALAVKQPIPIQILFLTGLVMLLWRCRPRSFNATWLFLLLPPLLYVGLASISSLQLGLRLILPALPFFLLISGVALQTALKTRWSLAVGFLVVWLAIHTAVVYPHVLSFFNLWVGGSAHGLQYLADSNIDWGQDLGEVADYVIKNRIPRIHLFYFGGDNPYRFLDENRLTLMAPPWSESQAQGLIFQPEPGYYAISANLLPGHAFRSKFKDYFQVFRSMQPVYRAGYSIFIYKIESRR